MKVSILVPVYNEEKTVGHVIKKLTKLQVPGIKKEIIIINDGSNDKTAEEINKCVAIYKELIVITHDSNKGKGSAIASAYKKISGDYVLIQDADLEYDPSYIPSLLEPIKNKKSDVVFGTRLKRLPHFREEERTVRFACHYLGNRFLSLIVSVLYGTWLTDIETGYKVFPSSIIKQFPLQSKSFDVEVELTAKLLKKEYTILEVPITTKPRGYREGKKLQTLPAGLQALYKIIIYKFVI